MRVEQVVAHTPGEVASTAGPARSVRRREPLPSTLENLAGADTIRSCLDRQVQEGVRITLDGSDELLNSKSEYHQPGVTRVVTTREVAERTWGR